MQHIKHSPFSEKKVSIKCFLRGILNCHTRNGELKRQKSVEIPQICKKKFQASSYTCLELLLQLLQ